MTVRRALVIDDEEGVRSSLCLLLGDEGYDTCAAGDASAALDWARRETFQVVLCDVRMKGRSGLDVLPELVALQPEAIVLVMSAYGDVQQALEAVRRGAYDYLSKPFEAEELMLAIRKAQEREQLERENRNLRRELGSGRSKRALIAASEGMKQVVDLVERAAEYKTTVLVTGESGVGKEVVARTIHELSDRAEQPFIAINCGAIPESLLESEFFGHARGAFTGANEAKAGLFREADGGTLFLDEIGELPPGMQVKLLRVLQEEEVRPVGEPKPIHVDVRILAATARDLEGEVATGRFRADLYYRLNVFRVVVPPLRERPEDIPPLADHLLESLMRRVGKSVAPIGADVLAALRAYAWPGNVRELENALERALILARGPELTLDLLPFAERRATPRTEPEAQPELDDPDTSAAEGGEDLSIKRRGRALEERLIRLALARTRGNRTHAARVLEMSPRALQYKIKEYAIEPLNPVSGRTDTGEQ